MAERNIPLIHKLQAMMQSDYVSRLNLREAILIKRTETVASAIEQMRAKGLGCVIIIDGVSKKPLGIFSELGMIHLLIEDADALTRCVGDHMDANWACLQHDDPIIRVIDLMHLRNTRYVVVCWGAVEGVDIDATDRSGRTPLMFAALGRSSLELARQLHRDEIVALLEAALDDR